MISEHDSEPVRGLPGKLPPGERILWQGTPDWRRLAIKAYHVRPVAAYFVLLAGWALAVGNLQGAAITVGIGAAGVGVLTLIAWGAARSTVYTLTNKRLVLRFGIALPKCINLPLATVSGADLAPGTDGYGDIALKVAGTQRLGWIALWPHARPWRVGTPEPMLRSIPAASEIGALIARACGAASDAPAAAMPIYAVAA